MNEVKKRRIKFAVTLIVTLILIPSLLAIGVLLLKGRNYNVVSIVVAVLALIPFFVSFERAKSNVREVVIVAVMTALSVVGRMIFYPIPAFKPVTAIVIITGICLGKEAGFLTGAMSALVSNMFFGQGPWTPFQMFTWGLLGFIVGLFSKTRFIRTKPSLIISGVFGGAAFSLIMDVWTVVNIDETINLARYLTALVTSLPFMAMYAVSNVIFLLLLFRPIDRKLLRIKLRFNVFGGGNMYKTAPVTFEKYLLECGGEVQKK